MVTALLSSRSRWLPWATVAGARVVGSNSSRRGEQQLTSKGSGKRHGSTWQRQRTAAIVVVGLADQRRKQHRVMASGGGGSSGGEGLSPIKIAKNSGSIISYDPNLRLGLWPTTEAAREGIMSVWDQADIIKISEEEVTFLTGGEDPNDDNVVLEKLFHSNLKLLIVTEGLKGCRYYTKEFRGRVAGIKVKPVDTNGAGDAFAGGMLYCLASDLNLYKDEERLREALVFANA
ncbi:hypothetical protein NL676_016362 [Syzygium grande]|nr:hypothetical protein NL676_016362 [Syzygium grande]